MSELDRFIRASDRVVEFHAYFTALPQDDHTIHTLDVQMNEIVHLWDTLRSAYDTLLLNVGGLEEEVDLETVKNKFYVAYSAHLKCLSRAKELLDNLKKTTKIIEIETSNASPSRIHLPPCDIEDFYGDYDSWPSFRDQFSGLFVNQKQVSPVEKLCHLLKKTKGEAREIVKSCPFTNAGFDLAWQNLMDRYENKRVLINAQLKTLFNLQHISKENGPSIKNLQRTINNCVANLSLLKIDTKNWDVIFVYICSISLPDITLNLWEQSLKNNSELPTWKEMDSFLTSRFHTLESVTDIRTPSNCNSFKKHHKKDDHGREGHTKVNSFQTNVNSSNLRKCALCQDEHPLRLCPVFLRMSIEERFSTVRSQKRCTNCLATSHEYKKCKSQFLCAICKQRHHSLLHRKTENSSQSPPMTNSITSKVSNSTLPAEIPSTSSSIPSYIRQSYSTRLQSTSYSSILLGTALVDICVGESRFTVRALIDPASEASFISKHLQTKFSLSFEARKMDIVGLNGSLTATSSKICSIVIGSPSNKDFQTKINVHVVRKLTGQLPYHSFQAFVKSGFAELQMADKNLYQGSHVDLLLGGDIYPQILLEGVRWNNDRSLVAQHTVFGWIITGKVFTSNVPTVASSFYNELTLNHQLSKFWELEKIPEASRISEDDEYCEAYYKATTYRDKSGRFVVSLPFRRNFQKGLTLGSSRSIALRQFLRNETRLNRFPNDKLKYDSVVTEYLTLGHMKRVNNETSDFENCYYLPHHAVLKPESTTTKLRVVFNASNPTSNGISLNDVLYPGPILQSDLTVLILRWRFFKYVFSADIEKMYRQILVDSIHTPFQRIIFRSSVNDDIEDYELNTVTFGVNCAPYLAIRTLLELAKVCENQNPVVSDILRNYMYIDDVLYGAHTISEAISAQHSLINVLHTAGFSLRKWSSNHPRLLSNLPPEHLLNANFFKFSEASSTKTLGLKWNAKDDFFYFNSQKFPDKNCITKRAILSEIARLFDPAGWLAPKVIVAKMIMQLIWKDQSEWDDEVSPQIVTKWKSFLDDYACIQYIKIPRFINYNPNYTIELHGFCDASEKAYAAVLYLSAKSPNGEFFSNILIAKTKVAPLKFITLPRKELCGAELLAKMTCTIRKQLKLENQPCFLWTDSTIVLAWLRKPAYSWTTFVANRVALINENVGSSVWSHVDSKDNPADLASRGITARELAQCPLWWHGPNWLKLTPNDRPSGSIDFETNEELRPIKSHITQEAPLDILLRFSDLPRALRVICYIFRFFYQTHPTHKQCQQYPSKELSYSEISSIRLRLIKMCQKLYFPEYKLLSQGLLIPPKSSLLTLNPFLDPQGIMRVNGRLTLSQNLSYNERYPKILPYMGRFTRLYMEFLHKCSLHGSNSLLTRLMRLEFWVPKLKNLSKSIVHNCKNCALQRHVQSQQIMAALPQERVTLSRPFTFTGVDFAGPFDIKSYVGRGCKKTKGYVLVFVCFATKAIHLEATSDISTDAFLAAFARFFSRRGSPQAMYSDNGTAFVGAANLLSKDRNSFLSDIRKEIISGNAFQPVEWHFIPPSAPHMGGLWEAGVKSFKTHLRKIGNSHNMTYEEFYTMLTRIEGCLNSRPLTPMSDNPTELCALTPGHFLIGSPLLAPPEPDFSNEPISLQNRWKKVQILHHTFALRWKEEYLKELHKRVKWKYPHRDFSIGDLVVIRQDNFPPNKWRLGRIENVVRGSDSKVRVAEVRTSNGLIVRPIVKLVLLPSPEQS